MDNINKILREVIVNILKVHTGESFNSDATLRQNILTNIDDFIENLEMSFLPLAEAEANIDDYSHYGDDDEYDEDFNFIKEEEAE